MAFLRKRNILTGTLVALALLLVSLFLYGPLFPWSPFESGYARLATQRADVYYPEGAPIEPAYRQVDAYIAESENAAGAGTLNKPPACPNSWITAYMKVCPHARQTKGGAGTPSVAASISIE